MANIQTKLLEKYKIDINKTNILKLYKIDSADISLEELEKKIADCRKKWTQSINGANEKFAQRDRAHLENADSYEIILRNKKLRKELYDFYNRALDHGEKLKFAREYFTLIATTKKIKRRDVDFFFDYYQQERKNKKAILEMLSKEFKVSGLGKEKNFANEEDEIEKEGKKKNKHNSLVVNLFQEATILKVHKCEGFFQKSQENAMLCKKYPALNSSIYEFLEMDKEQDIETLSKHIAKWREEAFAQRQERGQDYATFVDLFNTLTDLLEYQDVADNFLEFKLLIKYPKLMPYMYELDEMKQATLKDLYSIASGEYVFQDLNDFVLNYFEPIYDNFNINAQAIKKLFQQAEKKANANSILNEISEKLGFNKGMKIPVMASVVHYLVYWPIVLFYFIFEVCKFVFSDLKKLAIPIFVLLFIGSNWFFPKWFGINNLLILTKIVDKYEWYNVLQNAMSAPVYLGGLAVVMQSILYILVLLFGYALPSFFVALFVHESGSSLSKRCDWLGIERTFQKLFYDLQKKTEQQFRQGKNVFYKKKLSKIITNIICVVLIAAIVHFAPSAVQYVSEKPNVGKTVEEQQVSNKEKKRETKKKTEKKQTEKKKIEEKKQKTKK